MRHPDVTLNKVGAERLVRAITENHDRLGRLELKVARGPGWESLQVTVGGRQVAAIDAVVEAAR